MDLPEGDIRKLLPNKEDQIKWTAQSNHNIKRFSLDEVERITSNYGTIIGQGAFSVVYQGVLNDTSMVAVKKLKHKDEKMNESFAKELLVHSQINHRNVARLIGYCLEENSLMIVTEYIPGGNLNDFLHKDNRSICLDTRLRIATECAEALDYMHKHMYTRVIHGDIKPDNILLDHNLTVKISDFGISRLINTDKTLYTENVAGSMGYMDPLFLHRGLLTTKSDVYSFGVVLVQLITRKRFLLEYGKVSLVANFTENFSKGFKKVKGLFDAEIISEKINMKILEGIGKLACECLSLDHAKRPDMTDVVERLRKLRKALDGQEAKPLLYFWRTENKPAAPDEKIIPMANTDTAVESLDNKLVMFGSLGPGLHLDLEDLLSSSAEVLAKGDFGTTYKANMECGVTVVVKRLRNAMSSEKEFRLQAAAIGAIGNEFVLPLRGYYFSKEEKFLLYDYMPMGSLAALIYGSTDLDMEHRLTIAFTAARGLAAIHSAGATSCHGNIKSSNVFLTEGYEARLSEHGLFTLLGSASSLLPMNRYHPPEVRGASQEADVYSFGVLLLELFTGEDPGTIYQQMLYESPLTQKDGRMMELVLLAKDCCSQRTTDRPAMTQVAERIQNIRQPPVRSVPKPLTSKAKVD